MKKLKFFTVLSIVFTLLITQAGAVFASPALQEDVINGTVTALECVTEDGASILVTFEDEEGLPQQTEIDLETAIELGLITIGEGDVPDCSEGAFEAIVNALSEDEPQHPVGTALSLFFSDVTDYDTIMAAHEDGTGFGVLAQALWLTMKMKGDSYMFLDIVESKKSKDFSYFDKYFEDDATPQNWGQFKKTILNGDKKANLGTVMSDNKDKTNNGNGQDKDKNNNGNKNKDKDKEK